MFKMKTITLSLLALLLVMSFASCASDTTSDLPLPSKDMKAYLQVKVTVDGSGDTRASRAATGPGPQGGEDGDGRVKGTNHENEVNSLTVLLYESDKDDLSDDNAIIEYVYTFTNLNKVTPPTSGKDATYTTVPKEIDAAIVGKNYHVIVIANADDMTSKCKGQKIKDVRDLQMSKVCTRDADITKFSNFIMSSKKDAKIDFTKEGSETDPYQVEVDIERLAARIDIIPNATYVDTDKGYYYNVMDGTNVIGGFKLESVTPTKVMKSGEYLIKRVFSNKTVPSVTTYYGEETKDAANKATNYVVCPWTKDRTGLTLSNAEGPASLYNVKKTTSTSTTTGDASYILDYVMENTTTDNDEAYSTGLIFKGKYYEETEWDATKKQPKGSATGTEKEYTYTLRHSDPSGSGTKADPMHFGVVRNNIYQVKVEGVEGKSKGLTLTIHVRKWATYTHEETTM